MVEEGGRRINFILERQKITRERPSRVVALKQSNERFCYGYKPRTSASTEGWRLIDKEKINRDVHPLPPLSVKMRTQPGENPYRRTLHPLRGGGTWTISTDSPIFSGEYDRSSARDMDRDRSKGKGRSEKEKGGGDYSVKLALLESSPMSI